MKPKDVEVVGADPHGKPAAPKPGQPTVAAKPPHDKAATVVKPDERAPEGLKRFRCRGKPQRSESAQTPPAVYIIAPDRAAAVAAYIEHVGTESAPDAAAVVVVDLPD